MSVTESLFVVGCITPVILGNETKELSVIDIHTYFVRIKGSKLLQRWTPMVTKVAAVTLGSNVFR